MSGLQNFSFEGQEVRFVGTADNPEWVAVDICKVLELTDPSRAAF
jgi:prophage antirepressor-like protein